MKAIVQVKYGSPEALELKEIDKPVIKDTQVLVRVHAAGVNPLDWHFVRGQPYIARLALGLPRPKNGVRGVDVAGHVEAVGKNVRQYQAGDEVFGACDGAFAEYAPAGGDMVVPKPANLTFDQAAAVPVAAVTALQALRDVGKLQSGQKVLINGAAGGVGTFAVQIAKSFGADVTAVCSTRNVELVRSIGADHVVDYTREDFTRSGSRYDVILDNAGSHSLGEYRRVLAADGTLIMNSGAALGTMAAGRMLSPFVRQKLRSFLAKLNREDLIVLCKLIEAGKLTSVIDRTYPLSQTPEAIGYVEAGHARGKVVITVRS
ncbi:MAG: NAD(P)-dependent alcohol dehydrogenase [Chloroflexi bacterium]|nr:MAG: NAD(P)-dependent alcohol dehydrogenase [Chloroflexota bacterium]